MNENRKFRNHISVVLEQTAGALAAIAVLVVTQLLEHLNEILKADLSFLTEKGALIVPGVILLLAAAVIAQVLVWRKTYISIEDNAVVIEKGSVNKQKNTIGIRNISNINLEQNLIEMLFGTCKVKLDTNSRSTADSTDVKIVLKKADALWFRQEVARRIEAAGCLSGLRKPENEAGRGLEYVEEQSGAVRPAEKQNGAVRPAEDEEYDVRADLGDVLRHGIFSISAVSVVIFILALAGTVFSMVETVRNADLLGTAAGGAAGIAVAALIALSSLWDTVKDFVRYYDFRAKHRDDKIHIQYGFFKKVEYTIPVDKIQALKIRQSMVARIGRRYMAEIINVGMGDDQEEKNSFLILYCAEDELRRQLRLLLPEYADTPDIRTERMPASVWAAWSIPFGIFAACTFAAAAAAAFVVPEKYIRFVWSGAAAVLALTLLCMFLRYRTAGTGTDRRILKTAGGYFGRQYLCVPFRNIQYVEFSSNPAARATGISRGTMHLLASSADAAQGIPYSGREKEEMIKERMPVF